jgi:glycosyltransferase involved in cell wall biosynthesis
MSLVSGRLRRWDVASATRVSSFIANSENVRERIRRFYDRDAAVLYPPVAVDRFTPAVSRDDFYIIVSALVPYKRIDLAVAAFNKLGRRLLVVGEGPELPKLQNGAEANVVFLGHLPDEEVAELLGRARGFIVPGEEDFGIAPVEAQAAGTPVIAFRRGGVLETVIDAEAAGGARGTGVFFDLPTVEALADAVVRFEKLDFKPGVVRANAERFNGAAFARGLVRMLAQQQTAAA